MPIRYKIKREIPERLYEPVGSPTLRGDDHLSDTTSGLEFGIAVGVIDHADSKPIGGKVVHQRISASSFKTVQQVVERPVGTGTPSRAHAQVVIHCD